MYIVNKKVLHIVSFVLVIFGAIDLGLFGLMGGESDIINYIFAGDFSVVAVILETLIGAAGVYLLFTHSATCKACEKK